MVDPDPDARDTAESHLRMCYLNNVLESCAQSSTGRTPRGTLAQRDITQVHPNGCPGGTREIVFGTH